ncbi:hypothetical protein GQ43DRAFT_281305 [Delitschia confertaspora ATCC 74209]|uniref:Uncharacterized protein n=1 Tax=Delitschia confertaspora ATCC 74209 TaxID=1513339 RepID=A0A9P4MQJ6_9PLEO|nr:hypothetical protein GQ43DRAFT_281305 [Delitschia confertaspora ATCC 74209]
MNGFNEFSSTTPVTLFFTGRESPVFCPATACTIHVSHFSQKIKQIYDDSLLLASIAMAGICVSVLVLYRRKARPMGFLGFFFKLQIEVALYVR